MAKADAVAGNYPSNTWILAADTSVALNNIVFNKPDNRDHAKSMLRELSGKTHSVWTGMALLRVGGETILDAVEARVTFNSLTDELIDRWIASGEADDKAGAYGIQALGREFPQRIKGDLSCVIGLPMARLQKHLFEAWGYDPFQARPLREIVIEAYPDTTNLPEACLRFSDV